jgi:hypothetical protein
MSRCLLMYAQPCLYMYIYKINSCSSDTPNTWWMQKEITSSMHMIHDNIHEKHKFIKQTWKLNIKSITIHNQSGIVYVCFVLLIFCLYICVCECLLYNNNHKTRHKNNTNCGSAFEPGASGLPYYCTSICVRFGCTRRARRASCADSKPTKKKNLC